MLIKVLKLKLNYKFWYSNRLKHWPYCYYINLLVLVCHAARGTGNGSELFTRVGLYNINMYSFSLFSCTYAATCNNIRFGSFNTSIYIYIYMTRNKVGN